MWTTSTPQALSAANSLCRVNTSGVVSTAGFKPPGRPLPSVPIMAAETDSWFNA